MKDFITNIVKIQFILQYVKFFFEKLQVDISLNEEKKSQRQLYQLSSFRNF